jgi:hypothetical protein
MNVGTVIGKDSYSIKETSRSNALETCKMEHGTSLPYIKKTFEIK